jgi:DNA-binding XRE family transcriptional regulator
VTGVSLSNPEKPLWPAFEGQPPARARLGVAAPLAHFAAPSNGAAGAEKPSAFIYRSSITEQGYGYYSGVRGATAGLMDSEIDLYVGKRLHARRRLLGLTLQQLASDVGVSFQQLQKYECGANRISVARLWRLAQALDVSVTYFFDGLTEDDEVRAGREAV